jgi:DNA-binding transcriptional MerR regulator
MTPAESPSRPLRIGELAERVGTTARTIRYYEEIGLLGGGERDHGRHRSYTEDDVDRLEHVREWHDTEDPAARLRIVDQALGHIATQLELVERRQAALGELESELREREALARRRRAELGG